MAFICNYRPMPILLKRPIAQIMPQLMTRYIPQPFPQTMLHPIPQYIPQHIPQQIPHPSYEDSIKYFNVMAAEIEKSCNVLTQNGVGTDGP